MSYSAQFDFDKNQLSILVSAFSIFSALLFSSQIAAFSVYNYKLSDRRASPQGGDETLREVVSQQNFYWKEDVRLAFRKINATISFLTFISILVLAIAFFLTLEIMPDSKRYISGFLVYLICHFVCIFLFVCLQIFEFFDFGYRDDEQ
ncbi:MAG: hypothetical protein ACK42D_04780 [Candidatus Paceibacteria bacterium]